MYFPFGAPLYFHTFQQFNVIVGLPIRALLRGLRERRRFLALAAVFLLLNALSDWHYVIYAVVMTAIMALAEALRLRRLRAVVTQIGKLALVGGIYAVIAMPATSAMPVEVPMTLRNGETGSS